MKDSTRRVLLVDRDPMFVRRARAILDEDVDLQVVSDAGDALSASEACPPDLVMVDPMLADGDAFELVDQLREQIGDAPLGVLYITHGPAALTRIASDRPEFLGAINRELDSCSLLRVVNEGLGAGF